MPTHRCSSSRLPAALRTPLPLTRSFRVLPGRSPLPLPPAPGSTQGYSLSPLTSSHRHLWVLQTTQLAFRGGSLSCQPSAVFFFYSPCLGIFSSAVGGQAASSLRQGCASPKRVSPAHSRGLCTLSTSTCFCC